MSSQADVVTVAVRSPEVLAAKEASPAATTDSPSDSTKPIVLPAYINLKSVRTKKYVGVGGKWCFDANKDNSSDAVVFQVVSDDKVPGSFQLKYRGYRLGEFAKTDGGVFLMQVEDSNPTLSLYLLEVGAIGFRSPGTISPLTFGLVELARGSKGEGNFYISIGPPPTPDSDSSSALYISDQSGDVGYDLGHALFIQPTASIWTIEPAVDSREIYDIVYNLEQKTITSVPPYILTNVVDNQSTKGDASHSGSTAHANFSYEQSTVGTWNNALGWEVSDSIKISAGVPGIVNVENTLTVSANGSYNWGGSTGETITRSQSVDVEVPPGSKRKLTFTVTRANLRVNFTYSERVQYRGGIGLVTRKNLQGVYENVETLSATTQIGDVEDINS